MSYNENMNSKLPKLPDGYEWKLIPELSDEFNGSELDKSKWVDYHHYWKGRDPSNFDPKNISVCCGNLRLRSTTEISDLSSVGNPETDIWVKSACVSSKTPCASYGYYEAKMRASQLSMTSSFWFQGKYSEIDVVEQLGKPLNDESRSQYMHMNTHYYKGGWETDKPTPNNWKMPSGASDDFHIYGVWWKDKDNIWFYHNGQKVAEAETVGEFLEPMYMFFDTEVFKWEGLPTIESLKDPEKNTMYVDWVRSWKALKTE